MASISNNFTPRQLTVILLDGVEANTDGAWYRLPRNVTFEVEGITTGTVTIEWKATEASTAKTLWSTTSDATQACSDVLGLVRATVTGYSAGTITVAAVAEN